MTDLCSVCGRPPHVHDDPECIPANKPIAEQLYAAIKMLEKLRVDNAFLRDWIRNEGEITNTCTFSVLEEICNGCKCNRGKK